MRGFSAALGLALVASLGAAPGFAEEAEKSPTAVVEEITSEEATITGPSGEVEASTGEATPTENWFGCPPDKGQSVSESNAHCDAADATTTGSSQQATQ